MASDLDRYGSRLGRRFLGVRALICSEVGSRAAAQALASYISREFFKADRELEALYREGRGLAETRSGWLPGIQDAALQRLLRGASRSLPACHIVEAVQDLLNSGTTPPTGLLQRVAARALDGTEARLHTQRDYAEDKDVHSSFVAVRQPAEAELLRLLGTRLERDRGRPSASPVRQNLDPSSLLDLVVARSANGRQN
jgi:hypothetical protein